MGGDFGWCGRVLYHVCFRAAARENLQTGRARPLLRNAELVPVWRAPVARLWLTDPRAGGDLDERGNCHPDSGGHDTEGLERAAGIEQSRRHRTTERIRQARLKPHRLPLQRLPEPPLTCWARTPVSSLFLTLHQFTVAKAWALQYKPS